MAQRKRYGGGFKARVAIEAIAGHKTVNEIASSYEVHPSQVGKWKAEAGVALSMDDRGRVFNNIFTERLWRSVKHKEVYLRDYEGVKNHASSQKICGSVTVLPCPARRYTFAPPFTFAS